ncbi:MAG: hypothetical protein RBG13Loki_4275 [Promethearchaeota archaeon CR_4]|nr:MAG: hypothetical protein RBG13Loki_4275 [Candidatus Lokiarchaeota archaeon CR_4]
MKLRKNAIVKWRRFGAKAMYNPVAPIPTNEMMIVGFRPIISASAWSAKTAIKPSDAILNTRK